MKNVGRKKNVAEEKKEVEKMDSEEAVRIRESLPQAYPPRSAEECRTHRKNDVSPSS
jgi:hypothetical protein